MVETLSGGFSAGDRVRIKNYKTAIAWGSKKPQEFGFVTAVDGAYIYVRPRWSGDDHIIEFYPGEIEHAPLGR